MFWLVFLLKNAYPYGAKNHPVILIDHLYALAAADRKQQAGDGSNRDERCGAAHRTDLRAVSIAVQPRLCGPQDDWVGRTVAGKNVRHAS